MAKKKKPVAKRCVITGEPILANEPAPGYCNPTTPVRCHTPAFPHSDKAASRGMSLRDYFAAKAGAAMYGNADLVAKAVSEWSFNGGPRPTCVAEWFAGMAYEFADKMLEARK